MAASHVLRKWDLVLFQINTRGGRKETTPSPFIPTMLRSRDSALRYFQPHQMSFISFNVSGIANEHLLQSQAICKHQFQTPKTGRFYWNPDRRFRKDEVSLKATGNQPDVRRSLIRGIHPCGRNSFRAELPLSPANTQLCWCQHSMGHAQLFVSLSLAALDPTSSWSASAITSQTFTAPAVYWLQVLPWSVLSLMSHFAFMRPSSIKHLEALKKAQ